MIHYELKLDKYTRWRKQAKERKLSIQAIYRLEWIISYNEGKSVKDICKQFGISKTVFYKWKNRFIEHNIVTLESKSRIPKKHRYRVFDPKKDNQVISLREEYPYYGKIKLKVLYERIYQEEITSWYIQRVIETYNLYPAKRIGKGTTKREKRYKKKKRITEFNTKCNKYGYLLHLDTVEIRMKDKKIFILTAIDEHTRIGFAYGYKNHSSKSAEDFLNKLKSIFGKRMVHIHTDNGSEFAGYFEEGIKKLHLEHWYSRARVSNDNAMCERFNRTLQDEVSLKYGYSKDIYKFNDILLLWLLEYNSIRPHASLNYSSPLQFLSTMSSSCSLTLHIF